MRKLLLPLLAALGLAAALAAEMPPPAPAPSDSPYRVRTSIDWKRRVLSLEVDLDLKKAGLSLPEGRISAQRMVGRDLPGLAKAAFFDIPVDAEGSIGDALAAGDIAVDDILGLADKLRPLGDALSKDLLTLRSRWELPLADAAALFVTWSDARPIAPNLGWTATKSYTGILIFAQDPLPVHGERGVQAGLHRGLFPRILSEDMEVLSDRYDVNPSLLVTRGPLGYIEARSADDEERIGDDPLLVRAIGLFGSRRTDLLISEEDAARILADPANRRLLAEGRVLVLAPREEPARP